MAYLVSGQITSRVEGQPERIYRAGECRYETPGAYHLIGRDASNTEPAKLLAAVIADTGDNAPTTPGAPLAIDEFQFRQAQQLAGKVHALGHALLRHLVVFARECRRSQRLQMVLEQNLRPAWRDSEAPLRVLQERKPNAPTETISISVAVIVLAATYRELNALVAEGRFREDLYRPMRCLSRRRPGVNVAEIPLLVEYFDRPFGKRAGGNSKRSARNP